jgi:hypothetical protein
MYTLHKKLVLLIGVSVLSLYALPLVHGKAYEASSGQYIQATVAKYLQDQNITVFKYQNADHKSAYFALVGKHGLSVRTTLGKKIAKFSYGGPKKPRTITRYRIYEGQIIGNTVYLSARDYTKISRRTAHAKLLTGYIFEDQNDLDRVKKSKGNSGGKVKVIQNHPPDQIYGQWLFTSGKWSQKREIKSDGYWYLKGERRSMWKIKQNTLYIQHDDGSGNFDSFSLPAKNGMMIGKSKKGGVVKASKETGK